jgi:anti-anti-sigma regulatory factor
MHLVQDRFRLDAIAADTGTQVLVLGGTVAMAESRALESRVIHGIRVGRTRVVIDFTDVAATGPGLLGALLRIRRGITGVDGRLALVVNGPPVSELVATSLLARLIHVTADRGHAIEYVRDR